MSNHRYNRLFNAVILGIFVLFAGTTAHAQLSGEYYIPQGDHDQGFDTFHEALNALNDQGANGVVTFFIDDDLDERGYGVRVTREDLSENTQLIIKPAPDKTPTIIMDRNQDAGFRTGIGMGIEYASWVTIDGSNQEDGNSHDLTFTFDDEDMLLGIYIYGSAENVTIKNLTLNYIHDSPVSSAIRVRHDDQGNIPTNVLIENGLFGSMEKPFTDGLTLWGASEDLPLEDVTVRNCTMYGRYRGIANFWNFNNELRNNVIHLLGTATGTTWLAGIYTPGWINSTMAGNEIIIYGVTDTESTHISGILFNTTRNVINVYNNTISTADDFQASQDHHRVYGIANHREGHESSVYNIFHNTIRIGETGLTGRTAAIGWDENVTQNNSEFNIENNILINEADAANSYGIHWNVVQTANGEMNSDHNNIYAPDAHAGYWVDEATTSFSDWQFASDQDNNSVSTAVAFVSNTNLRLAEENTDLITTNAISLVWYDIDDKERDPSGVYMGAHEFDPDVSVPPTEMIADGYWLAQNYPNPFNPSTNIRFHLPVDGQVKIEVYTVMGQLVDTIVNEYRTAGEHIVTFDARSLSSGVYIYRITAGEYAESKRMMFMK
jgi:hypothetical protein